MTKITLKQMQVFVNTARYHTLTKAASRCFISQAAASMSLLQLEQMLGAPLFDRIGKRLRLNANGKALLPKAIAILDQTQECENLLGDEDSILQGTLTLGASTTIASYVLPAYLATFKQQHPQVEFNITIGNTEDIVQDIQQLNLDVGLIEGVCHANDINMSKWMDDELNIICRRKHPLAQKKTIMIKELLNYNWVSREMGSGTRNVFTKAMNFPQDIKIDITLSSPEAIKKYIVHSDCLGYLSSSIIQNELKGKSLAALNVKDLNLRRRFLQITHKNKYQTILCKTFLSGLRRGQA